MVGNRVGRGWGGCGEEAGKAPRGEGKRTKR